jgi:tetratricopeptide (TPR) repeat protein
LTDRACVDENYSSVCFENGATPESCGAWLRPFELSPSLDVRNAVAGTYLLVADDWQPRDPQPWLKDRAAALIHGILEQDPTNAEALLGLALLAPTNDERVALLRRVVAVDPSPSNLESLARTLSQDQGNLRESAALLERAYEAAMQRAPGPYAWRFARDAVFEYEWAGLPKRAARLRARFERDLKLDAKVAETANAEAVEPARLNSILGDICAEIILRMLGGNRCLAGIEHVVDAADRVTVGSVKARLVKSASDAMFLAAQTGGDVLVLADPAWRDRFVSTLQRYFGSEPADRMRHTLTEITVE